MNQVKAYCRVSSDRQDNESQQMLIHNFCNNRGYQITPECFTIETISTKKKLEQRQIFRLVNSLKSGDLLIVAELTRLARSVKEIMVLLQICINKKVKIVSVRENIELMDDITSTIYAMCFGIAGEIERQLISQRTKIALALKKSQGVVLGRPKGSKAKTGLVKSLKVDKLIDEMLEKKLSVAAIARMIGVHRVTLTEYLKKRNDTSKQDNFFKPKIKRYNFALVKETKHLEKVLKNHKSEESDTCNKVYAYLRVSTGRQDVESQKYNIENFAKSKNIKINDFFEEEISGAKDFKKRLLGEVFQNLKRGDTLLVSEISRLSRSLYMVFEILNFCVKNGIKVITVTDGFHFTDELTSKVFAFTLGLAAEVERKLISERTKAGLVRVKSDGIVLGRPKGSLTTNFSNILISNKENIKEMLAKKISVCEIARIYKVHRTTVKEFLIRENIVEDNDLSEREFLRKQKRKLQMAEIESFCNEMQFGTVKKFLERGFSPSKIAQDLNVPVKSVTLFMEKNNLVRENLSKRN